MTDIFGCHVSFLAPMDVRGKCYSKLAYAETGVSWRQNYRDSTFLKLFCPHEWK